MSSRPVTHRIALSVVFAVSAAALSGASCVKRVLKHGEAQEATPRPIVVPVKTGPTPPKIDYAAVRPNELGRIPVIMYHEIQLKPGKKNSLTRTVADFQEDLQTLYDAGFRPVNLSDVIDDKIDLPAGKMPVVLTFDDARASQFKLIETPQSLKIDPNSAMGIMDAFHKQHPDWPMKATFFVLPKSAKTLEPFGQMGLGDEKLDYIVSNGMEIGNHTTLHKNMREMSPEEIQAEIGNANNVILAAVPKATIETMAVPMGKFPHNKAYWKYLMEGTYEGKAYHYKAVMDAAWRPMYSPDDKKYNANRLERIDGTAPSPYGVRDWVKKLIDHEGYEPYVSDGDPNVISFPRGSATEANLAKIKAEGKLANPYSPFGGLGGAKPIMSDTTPTGAPAPLASGASLGAPTGGAPTGGTPASGAPAGGSLPIVSETTTPAAAASAAPSAAAPAASTAPTAPGVPAAAPSAAPAVSGAPKPITGN